MRETNMEIVGEKLSDNSDPYSPLRLVKKKRIFDFKSHSLVNRTCCVVKGVMIGVGRTRKWTRDRDRFLSFGLKEVRVGTS